MQYKVKRFSREFIENRVDERLRDINDLSTKLVEDENLGKMRPVKRYGRFAKDLTHLLRKKKKRKSDKQFSEDNGDINVNPAEANKFKTGLNRVISSMGDTNSDDLLK